MARPSVWRTVALTALALTAFASNSILCRAALSRGSIDAGGFTVVRLLAGVAMLLLLVGLRGGLKRLRRPPVLGPASLFTYAAAFSFAYLTLNTGTGALILNGAVQTTIIGSTLVLGGRLLLREWAGLAVAFSGFVILVWPSLSTPSVWGFVFMSLAGMSWGVYTLRGRGSVSPLVDTAANFTWTLPLVVVIGLITVRTGSLTPSGAALAVASGAGASALGYAVWYAALPGLTATQAGVVQLFVPVIAAVGGVVFSAEVITLRFLVAASLVTGGILMVILRRRSGASSGRE